MHSFVYHLLGHFHSPHLTHSFIHSAHVLSHYFLSLTASFPSFSSPSLSNLSTDTLLECGHLRHVGQQEQVKHATARNKAFEFQKALLTDHGTIIHPIYLFKLLSVCSNTSLLPAIVL